MPSISNLVNNCPFVSIQSSSRLFPQHASTADLPLLQIESPLCSAVVAIQGAQLLSHQLISGSDLLWLSPNAIFKPGKSIRGGIPICLPWFGKHADADKPQHGFVRNEDWQLQHASTNSENEVTLIWKFSNYSSQPHPLFPWRFDARLTMILGESIRFSIEVINRDSTPMPLTWALHSYHPVSDLTEAKIDGLEKCEYLDNTQGLLRFPAEDNIAFGSEFDRIYLNVPEIQNIRTEPPIRVQGNHCHSAIVWNPGIKVAEQMVDIGLDHYDEFICLERGNTADNALLLKAGDSHRADICIF